ncbi:MAG: anthranilate phosphoribosyltransferase [Pirellulales bacterium]
MRGAPTVIETCTAKLAAGEHLSMQESADAFSHIMSGDCDEAEIAALLLALRAQGESADEIAGAAEALRRHMTRIESSRTGLIDTCGTGGDASNTFNISTCAAFITAAAGVPVAKHGNRGVTSKSGSADVLAELGVNIEADQRVVGRCLDQVGIGFCFAPRFHSSMRVVAKVRAELAVPTIFNLLGPLCNPASAPFQLVGVGQPDLRPLMAEALGKLGIQRAVFVTGYDGLDEVTLTGPTRALEIAAGDRREFDWRPGDFGLEVQTLTETIVDGPVSSAKMIRQVLAGEPGAARDIAVINAAAALWTAGKGSTPRESARLAQEAIDGGAAEEILAKLAEESHRS